MPERIQRRRTAGWARGTAVIVDRTSRYGNPFRINGHVVVHPDDGRAWSCGSLARAREQATKLYRGWLDGDGPDTYTVGGRTYDRRVVLADLAGRLRGRDLACPCPLPETGLPDWCHAAVLMEAAAAAHGAAADAWPRRRPLVTNGSWQRLPPALGRAAIQRGRFSRLSGRSSRNTR